MALSWEPSRRSIPSAPHHKFLRRLPAEADDTIADGRAADRQRQSTSQGRRAHRRDGNIRQGGGRGQLRHGRGSRLHPTEVQSDRRRSAQGKSSDLHVLSDAKRTWPLAKQARYGSRVIAKAARFLVPIRFAGPDAGMSAPLWTGLRLQESLLSNALGNTRAAKLRAPKPFRSTSDGQYRDPERYCRTGWLSGWAACVWASASTY